MISRKVIGAAPACALALAMMAVVGCDSKSSSTTTTAVDPSTATFKDPQIKEYAEGGVGVDPSNEPEMIRQRDAVEAFVKAKYPTAKINGLNFMQVTPEIMLTSVDMTDGTTSRILDVVAKRFITRDGKPYWNVRLQSPKINGQLLLAQLRNVKAVAYQQGKIAEQQEEANLKAAQDALEDAHDGDQEPNT